jgi:hypothetical protein
MLFPDSCETVEGRGSSKVRMLTTWAQEYAEELEIRDPAPEGVTDVEALAASLKRCPDTKPSFSANSQARLIECELRGHEGPLFHRGARASSGGAKPLYLFAERSRALAKDCEV